MTELTTKDITQANKRAWDASAPLHQNNDSWNELLNAASQPNFNILDDCLSQTLRALDVTDKRAVQIGCNNARELLSLKAFGAHPELGIDQSTAFLAQAHLIAKAANQNPKFLQADIYDLPEGLGTYDLALITIGVLNWMPDLKRFFDVVAGLLSPNGVLVIYETHPVLEIFDPNHETPHLPAYSYFDAKPYAVDDALTYDGTQESSTETGYWMTHTLGDIVTNCIASGLQLQSLSEHAHSNRETEYDVYANQPAQLPMSYTLIARKSS